MHTMVENALLPLVTALTHCLHAQVHSKEQPLKVILESQYRPTQGNHVIEVCSIPPAGMSSRFQTPPILEVLSSMPSHCCRAWRADVCASACSCRLG